MPESGTWDIFCTVVDNFGDIGVTWRLARQLAREHGVAVRLWVDDLASFRRIWPEVDASLDVQFVPASTGAHGVESGSTDQPGGHAAPSPRPSPGGRGGKAPFVEVRRWTEPLPEVEPGDVVIEAMACDLPDEFIDRMAARVPRSVWLNLEYLTAEAWADGVHGLPSPHPRLDLTKHFFMPGFSAKTGGLLREAGLPQARAAFQDDAPARAAFWLGLELAPPAEDELRISLFGYENAAIPELLSALAQGDRLVGLVVPEGRAVPHVAAWLGLPEVHSGEPHARGKLTVHVLPMLDQDGYDRLLWACDVNFVRGEDSFVRAQFAARPMVWQAYRQEDRTHFAKLDAFLDLYCAGMSAGLAETVRALWHAWNEQADVGAPWPAFASRLDELGRHARAWCAHLAQQPDLASKLMIFCAKISGKR
jgi:uncharacterized repeat protein (TIGR03837 family)